MDVLVNSQTNGENDISLIIIVRYTTEEHEALTETAAWERACLSELTARLGLFRGATSIYRPTFRAFHDPGLRIQGLTQTFSSMFAEKFPRRYEPRIKKALAPILESYRSAVHQQAAEQRDSRFGVGVQQNTRLLHLPRTG